MPDSIIHSTRFPLHRKQSSLQGQKAEQAVLADASTRGQSVPAGPKISALGCASGRKADHVWPFFSLSAPIFAIILMCLYLENETVLHRGLGTEEAEKV